MVIDQANKKDKFSRSAFYRAVSENNIEMVKEFLEYTSTDINTTARNEWTPLIMASDKNYLEIFKELLKIKKEL